MSDAPVGVFDSGVGGLTVLRALTDELPNENFLYLGDTARLPYGTKSADTVVRYAQQATDALVKLGVKCIVVACNTASAAALPAIRDHARKLPVIGVIEPGAEAACAATRNGHIAVIATEATVLGGAYQQAIHRRLPDARVSARAAQLFVALAEEGLGDGSIAESIASHYLSALIGAKQPFGAAAHGAGIERDTDTLSQAFGIARDMESLSQAQSARAELPDTLVLGCTHFPMLVGAIRAVIRDGVSIVDSAATTARAVREALRAAGIARSAAAISKTRFIATDGPERFARVGSRFLGRALSATEVQVVDL